MKIENLKECLEKKPNASLGLYIHIPFCRVRCQFCAFYVLPSQEKMVGAFLDGLHREIQLYGQEVGLETIPVSSVYFGGGTPTVLSSRQLVDILNEIHNGFSVTADAEISVEAHPGTINRERVADLRVGGFNRLSIGAQSFDDEELIQLGGRSVSRSTKMAVESAREAGFDNISLDLMYGFPGHTAASWERTLEATIALQPTHLSCYAFTVEEGSHFHDKVGHGTANPPDDEVQTDLAILAGEYLELAGFAQYEISNYSRPGFFCKHNLRYWRGESYLGLGPSAQSFVGGVRFGNPADLDSYCLALVQEELPVEQWELLDPQEAQREHIVFGLRTMEGVPYYQVESIFRLNHEWENTFQGLKSQGLIEEEEGAARLTRKGRQFADTVAVALL